MDTMTVEDYVRWGKLVKTWATGESYFAEDSPAIEINELPIPRSVDELKRQAALVGAGLSIPTNMVGLAIVQYSTDTVVIRLPPRERIKAKEAELMSSGTRPYPLPPIYLRIISSDASVEQKLDFHAARIGDYTISMCG